MNRTLVWQLAWRYLRGKRSANAVPLLSRISMIAIAVSSCALIILFSVFNGFEHLIGDLYKSFYPDIRISAARGKFFYISDQQLKQIRNTEGIQEMTRVIQDNVFVNSEDEQIVATLKGVERSYNKVNDIQPYISEGRDTVTTFPVPTAILGEHIAATLGLDVNNVFNRLAVYYPDGSATNPVLSPESSLRSLILRPDGTFHVQEEFDTRYILADFRLTQSLMKQEGKMSSVELKLNNADRDAKTVQKNLKKILGPSFVVETRYEQNKSIYIIMRSEKWAGYAILLFVLLIASFNMVGALSLLVLEKQKDIGILKTMGAVPSDIRNVVLLEGALWSLTGGIIGLFVGLLLCFGQYYFHWIKIQGAFVIDAYPVAVKGWDVVIVIVTVIGVGLLAALYPALKAAKSQLTELTVGNRF